MPAKKRKPDRFCVFCGHTPGSAKHKEHVVPQWLIRATGTPKRMATFGPDPRTMQGRRFAFSRFKFPACESCNHRYSRFESSASRILSKLRQRQPLDGDELSHLLDWCDKVRVGVWLGMTMLDKNISAIRHRFFIDQRIAMHDRLLVIYKLPPREGLTLFGTVGPIFQYSPVAFAVAINEIVLFNVSTMGLCSKALGFPYPVNIEALELNHPGGFVCRVHPGEHASSYPVASDIWFPDGGVEVYQTAVLEGARDDPDHDSYNTEYFDDFSARD